MLEIVDVELRTHRLATVKPGDPRADLAYLFRVAGDRQNRVQPGQGQEADQ